MAELAVDMLRIKDRLGKTGMWKTFQQMDLVIKIYGWEHAESDKHKH